MELLTVKEAIRQFGEYKLRNNGEIGFDCPKCGPRSKKFHLGVNVKKLVYNCFKCGYKGRLKGKIDLVALKPKWLGVKKEIKAKIPHFVPFTVTSLKASKKHYRYLRERGIGSARAIKMKVGYSADVKYFGRLVIPLIEDGEVINFVARSLDGKGLKEIGPSKHDGWINREEIVYGLDQITTGVETLFLVEGIFDAEHLRRLGFHAVALLGSNLSDIQIGKILSKNPAVLVLLFDGDDGGRSGARRAHEKLLKRFRQPIHTVSLDDGCDPDELTVDDILRYLKEV